MNIDFFNSSCSEASRNDSEFGLCDDTNSSKAYTDISERSKWIAVVKNDDNVDVQFTAIDNCLPLLKSGTKDDESTCDCMLTFDKSIYFIELKNRRKKGWFPKSIKQLENTISLIKKHHNIDHLTNKKAYACNKRIPVFRESNNAQKKQFRNNTGGFILYGLTEIEINETRS